jgi:hypothetical protein
MDNPKEVFFVMTDNLFTFNNYACDCVTDIENVRPGVVKKTVKVQALIDKPMKFAFAPSKGMVRLAKSGAVNSDRILTDLLSLPDGNSKKLFSFFDEYGFLFPLVAGDYEAIDTDLLHGLVNRIKAVVRLMTALSEARKDYKRILGLMLYLQLSRPIELTFACFGGQSFPTYKHPIYIKMENAAALPQSVPPNGEDTYSIADTIFSPQNELSVDEFNNIVSGYAATPENGGQSPMYKDIARLYCNAPNLEPEVRRTVDFLFHFQRTIGIIKNYTASGEIECYGDENIVKRNYAAHFNNAMKQALIGIAKVTVRDEIGYNLSGMRPRYDTETMSPSWEIQDMLTGIYVSIFFMRPGIELYRKCSNPSCNRMFLVNTTSSKRKYCTSSCRNAAAQRAHRLRKQTVD